MNLKLSRRQFLKGATIAGVGMALPLKFGVKDAHAFYQSPGLQKFAQPLRGAGLSPTGITVALADATAAPVTGVTHYTIGIQQFTDQLHPTFAPNSTKLWGFNPTLALDPVNLTAVSNPTPTHLGGIIIAQKGAPVQITFRNKLNVTKAIIPQDVTLGMVGLEAAVNRVAVHLHGGLVPWISDGGPFDWWGPTGTHGLSFLNNILHPGAAANEAEYYYPNDQSARLVWYHDHAHDITRTNAYSGIASAYIIRDSFEKGLQSLGLPLFIEESIIGNQPIRELPIVFQDKIFVDSTNIGTLDPTWVQKGFPTTTGSLWYPHIYERNRWTLIGAGRTLPNPSVIAEMFGDTMLINGTVYPEVQVEPALYRLRILNACNARFLNLQLYVADNSVLVNGTNAGITLDGSGNPTNTAGPNWLVIANEAGFLKNPVTVPSNVPFSIPIVPPINGFGSFGFNGSLITGPAERWDVLVDFSGVAPGTNIIMYNDAPAPFPSGDPRNDYFSGTASGPDTRVMMRFIVAGQPVVPALSITPATDLTPGIDPFLATIGPDGTFTPNVQVTRTRQLTLNEQFDSYGRLVQLVGTTTAVGAGKYGRPYVSQATEVLSDGDVEIWEIFNLTGDTHPMHFHLVNVQLLNREPFPLAGVPPFVGNGFPRSPEPTEFGWKETVKMNPGEITRVIMQFKLPPVPFAVPPSPRIKATDNISNGNEYVWHCHILEHEEHDMMRPLVVLGTNPTAGVDPEYHTIVSTAGGTVQFFVFGGTPPYTVTPSLGAPAVTNNAPFPNAKGTFSVTVPALAATNTYTYTITDSTNATIGIGTLIIAPL